MRFAPEFLLPLGLTDELCIPTVCIHFVRRQTRPVTEEHTKLNSEVQPKRTKMSCFVAVLAALAMVTTGLLVDTTPAVAQTVPTNELAADFKALIFSKTAGFRHDSIPTGIAAIEKLGAENNFEVDATEDGAAFTEANLAQYDAVIWLSTTGDVLNAEQQTAFEGYIAAGGGYAGIHAASDTEYDWPFYGGLVGAYFEGHPAQQNVSVKTVDQVHPSTAHLPATQTRFDELYNYRTNPRDTVHVLQELDEKSYTGGTMGTTDHPITWCQDYEGGRSWYTGLGHTQESFVEESFVQELLGGIQSAAGFLDADCSASQTANFDKVTLDDGTSNPMDLAPAADGRTFYLERDGRLQIVQPNGGTVTAGTVPVTLAQEFGLLGIELAPDFTTSDQLFLFYSPAGSTSDRVSRFTMVGDILDLASEEVIIEIPVQRAECCHAGGALQFDTKGNLYIAIGDNTNPFASGGYTPIDENVGRSSWDAQRTSGNTNDLRGKILRIHPETDGSYSIPAGNLFVPGTEKTLPEIYGMGFRNPFKIGIDPRTDTVLVADYGPDAGSANANRGPDGRVEWNALTEAGNYGWPYCVGANTAYTDYNFQTAASGAAFDCANGPTNDSPNNTGLAQLPPATAADVWYGYSTNPEFPEIGGGGAPMAGSVYVYDGTNTSERKWPEYWDGKAIFAEWNQGKLYSFQLDETTDELTDINRIMPGMSFTRPHAMEWGADGALYGIEWGSGFGGNNADSAVYRIDYVSGQRAPIAQLTADRTSGPTPLTVQFDSAGTRSPDGIPVTLAWDFNGDGTIDSTEAATSFSYTEAGNFTATLTVTDANGTIAQATQAITAGNTAPVITVAAPPNGGFFDFGDQVRYSVEVTDPEDGIIDCNNVIAQPALGHTVHAHPYAQYTGCEGIITVPGDEGHIGADIFGVITFTYTDKGAPGVAPLTTQTVLQLQPKRKEAEYFSSTGRLDGSTSGGNPGVQIEITSDPAGGNQNIGFMEKDDWFAFDPTNLTGIDTISVRAASNGGGTVEVRTGSPIGPVVGSAVVPGNGWQAFADVTIDVPADVSLESAPLYFVNTAGGLNINWVDFVGRGVTDNLRPTVGITATATSGTTPLTVGFETEATDPEGDLPLTYAWTFGDGGTSTEEDPEHTYTQAGTFTADVTVSDAKGAATSKSVKIVVTAAVIPTNMCLTGRSDGFDGTTLDTERWDRTVRANQDVRVENGSLVIPASKTDIYGAGEGTVPNIILQDLPAGAWQATSKLTFEARTQYQQAGLIVYGDDDNYAKFALQGRSTGSDAAQRVFQFIREEAGVPNEVAASNTASLGLDFPDTYFVRMTSDGTSLTASYSADGENFTAMSESKPLAGIENPKIGLLAFANSSSPADIIEAEFDWFNVSPDETVVVETPNDEFDGAALDGCRWSIVNEQKSGYRVSDGALQIDTTADDIYGAATGVPNFILQPQPEGDDWVVETKVDGSAFDRQYQQAGLILYGDDDNYVKLDILSTNVATAAVTRNLELRNEIGGTVQNPQPNAAAPDNGIVWLRLAKSGTTYTGSYSTDGVTWTQISQTASNAGLNAARVGIYALGATQQGTVSNTAVFDYFHVVREPVTATATVAPTTPNGSNDWYTENVTVTVDAQGGAGVVYREYNIDGAGWLEYTTPVIVTTDGEHTVEYRASAAADTTDTAAVSFRIDKTAPEASAELIVNEADPTLRTIAITSSDATSTVFAVEYRIGMGEWMAYTEAIGIDATAQVLSYRVTDGAGNIGAEGTLQVPEVTIDAPVLTVDVTLDPAAPNGANGWYTNAVTVAATGTTTGESEVTLEYSTDGLTFAALAGSTVISTEGASAVWVRAIDADGNSSETIERSLSIDTEVPTSTGSAAARTVTLAGEDISGGSGLDRVEFHLSFDVENAWRTYGEPFTISGSAVGAVTYHAVDVAGNIGASAVIAIAAIPVPEGVATIVVDDNNVAQGELITVTGTGFEPKAKVSVRLGSDSITGGTVKIGKNGGFSYTFTVPAHFEPGEYTVVIRSGDEVLAESQPITVTQAQLPPAAAPGPGQGRGQGQGSRAM